MVFSSPPLPPRRHLIKENTSTPPHLLQRAQINVTRAQNNMKRRKKSYQGLFVTIITKICPPPIKCPPSKREKEKEESSNKHTIALPPQ
jgi:hypothetical protein